MPVIVSTEECSSDLRGILVQERPDDYLGKSVSWADDKSYCPGEKTVDLRRINLLNLKPMPLLTDKFKLNGLQVECLLDTGSQVSLIRKTEAEKIGTIDAKEVFTIYGLGGIATHTLGVVEGCINIHGFESRPTLFQVVQDE